jgi:hypothetical protein
MRSAGNATSFAAAMIDLIAVSRNATAQFFKDECGPKNPPTRRLSADFSVNGFLDCHQSNKCLALRPGEEIRNKPR